MAWETVEVGPTRHSPKSEWSVPIGTPMPKIKVYLRVYGSISPGIVLPWDTNKLVTFRFLDFTTRANYSRGNTRV